MLVSLGKLTSLRIVGASQSLDLTPLSSIPNLQSPEIVNATITDLSSLASADSLGTLILIINGDTDLVPLSNVTRLTRLIITDNTADPISFVIPMTELSWLDLRRNGLTDIRSLLDNPGLGRDDVVIVDENPLEPISGLQVVTELRDRRVRVSANRIDDEGRSL